MSHIIALDSKIYRLVEKAAVQRRTPCTPTQYIAFAVKNQLEEDGVTEEDESEDDDYILGYNAQPVAEFRRFA